MLYLCVHVVPVQDLQGGLYGRLPKVPCLKIKKIKFGGRFNFKRRICPIKKNFNCISSIQSIKKHVLRKQIRLHRYSVGSSRILSPDWLGTLPAWRRGAVRSRTGRRRSDKTTWNKIKISITKLRYEGTRYPVTCMISG